MSSSVEQRFFVFIDRDGTLIEETNYLDDLRDVKFIAGSEQAIRQLREHGACVIVISNQSGVARGYFTEDFVQQTHQHLQEHLQQHDTAIDGFYYCPHHPEADCECRKPKPGLFRRAAQDLGMALQGFMIGDRETDTAAGRNAGLKTILVRTGYGEGIEALGNFEADYVATDLQEAVDWILQHKTKLMGTKE